MNSTIWSQIVEHELVEDVWNFYHCQKFPLQIRAIQTNKFSEWIETNYKKVADSKKFKSQFFVKLTAAIEQRMMKAKLNKDALCQVEILDLKAKVKELETRFVNDPSGFLNIICQCLEAETQLLVNKRESQISTLLVQNYIPDQPQPSSSSSSSPSPSLSIDPFSADEEISDLRIKLDELVAETNQVRQMENAWQPHQISFNDAVLEWQIELGSLKASLNNKAKIFADLAQGTFQKLDVQVNEISRFLKLWAVDQRRCLNGAKPTVPLAGIAILTTTVAEGLLNLYQIIKFSNQGGHGVPLQNLQTSIRERAQKLIRETFIVVEQPKQILLLKSKVKNTITTNDEENSKTGIKIRLLATFKCLDLPTVRVTLINRPEAKKIYEDQGKTLPYFPKAAMDLDPDSVERLMELDVKNNAFIANFKIEMPKSRRKDVVKDPDLVPRKKYYFHFQTHCSCPALDISNMEISTTSVPIIANTHTKRNDDSWAAILWDNATTELGHSPFEPKMEIGRAELVQVFSNLFERETGRPLSARNIQFLKNKLMSCSSNPASGIVTWDMFFSNAMKIHCLRPDPQNDSPDNDSEVESQSRTVKPVSFHTWFYEIKQFCTPSARNKTGIPKFWKDGKIEAFICKDDLRNIVMQKEGRFVLYFSEALLGGLTVAWYDFNKSELQRLSPFTPSTFVERKELERRLHDQEQIIYLYQEKSDDIIKKDAFPFPKDSSERMTAIQREIAKRHYIPTFQETRNMDMTPILMHPELPTTSGMRPFNSVTA